MNQLRSVSFIVYTYKNRDAIFIGAGKEGRKSTSILKLKL